MTQEKYTQIVRDVFPQATDQQCLDFIQPMLEIMDEIQMQSNEAYPSMKKWINDSFQMVRELTKEFYGL